MPPYKPVKSKSQSRALFALAKRGEISEADARGKTRAANFSSLPDRKGSTRDPKRPAARRPGAKRPTAKRPTSRRAPGRY